MRVAPPQRLYLNPRDPSSGWIWDPETKEGTSCDVDEDGECTNLSEADVGRPPADWLPWTEPGDTDTHTDTDTERDGAPDPAARSHSFMVGWRAFLGGTELDAAVDADPADVDFGEAEQGYLEAREYVAANPDVIKPSAPPSTTEDVDAEAVAAAGRLELTTKLLALADVAEKECSAETLELARREFREWMREKGIGKPLDAMMQRLRELGPATVRTRGLIVHAAHALLDEGRADRATVPTQDAPNGVGDGKGKGKRGKAKAPKPKKSKRSTAWVKKLGVNVVVYKAAFAPDDGVLLEMLRAGGYRTADVALRESPDYGFCPIDDLTGTTAEIDAVPSIGADPEFRIWALKVAHKRGCPTHAFRAQAERQALAESTAEGRGEPSKARIGEITDALRSRWYATATPHLDLVPVTYHRPSMTFAIHGGNAEARNAALNRLRKLGTLTRVDDTVTEAREEARRLRLGRTALRAADAEGTGEADLGADALLWLVGRNVGGTAVASVRDHRVEWWLDRSITLDRPTADEKRLTVRLGGAPAEGGSLAAALADGASVGGLQLGLRLDGITDQEWRVTLTRTDTGLELTGWKLPARCKPDGTRAGLDAAIDDRLRTWQQGLALLDEVLALYVRERMDASGWRQRMTSLRQVLGLQMAKAWGVDKDGQGFLFAHMLPGEQGTLASVVVKDERKKGESRGRAARAAAGKPAIEETEGAGA